MLRLLADRDHQITAQRTRSICRLHALLCLLIEGGTGRSLTVARAEKLLASVHIDGPITIERIATARQLLDEVGALDAARVRGPPTPRHGDRGIQDDGHRGVRDRAVDGGDHHRPDR